MWPPAKIPQLDDVSFKLLMECIPEPKVDLEKFQQKSEEFPIAFGRNTCRVKSQPAERHAHICKQIASAYPVIHERTLALYLDFLQHKRIHGNAIEQRVYQNLGVCGLVQRLLEKRCVFFLGPNDSHMLINGHCGYGGFEKIGTLEEKEPLTLQNVLSYDEIKLSALLSTSTHTEFINDGARRNFGNVEQDKSKIEREGVIIGLIGSRFQRPNKMEWEDILITREQNTPQNGYGLVNNAKRESDYRRIWRQFYNEPMDFLYDEIEKDYKRFIDIKNDSSVYRFDTLVMKKRFAINFDTLLLEAQGRAMRADKSAYIHLVGFGLGVWMITDKQEKIFFNAFEERLLALGDQLSHVDVVHFSYFSLSKVGNLYDNAFIRFKNHPKRGIRIFISKRNPHENLNDNKMLSVVSYAWDSNALPGNEFWSGTLHTSSDPAAACSTLITELLNPHINVDYLNGNNLHIASVRYGLIHITEYAQRVANNSIRE
ncbi:uncharacterized protein [Drosophila tropicalis]|uniref:uncharacterized protein n=1 Tax=Drosophila tropicalis TaxID=46794 RepID=UPI0035AB83DB